jgi:hypothetical protein
VPSDQARMVYRSASQPRSSARCRPYRNDPPRMCHLAPHARGFSEQWLAQWEAARIEMASSTVMPRNGRHMII